jgi:hypothetical protein
MAELAEDIVSFGFPSPLPLVKLTTDLLRPSQRTTLPYTDETVVSYIVGLLEDEEEDEKDILEMTKGMLEGGPDGDDKLDDLEALSVRFRISASQKRVTYVSWTDLSSSLSFALPQDWSIVRVPRRFRDSSEAKDDRDAESFGRGHRHEEGWHGYECNHWTQWTGRPRALGQGTGQSI